jgi:hypothetical protein
LFVRTAVLQRLNELGFFAALPVLNLRIAHLRLLYWGLTATRKAWFVLFENGYFLSIVRFRILCTGKTATSLSVLSEASAS